MPGQSFSVSAKHITATVEETGTTRAVQSTVLGKAEHASVAVKNIPVTL